MESEYEPGRRMYCIHGDGNRVLKFDLCRPHLEAIRDDGWPEEPDLDDDLQPEEEPEPEPVAVVVVPEPKPEQHGTTLQYGRGCRCALCRKANTEHYRDLRARKQADLNASLTDHGTIETWRKGCTCDECKQAAYVPSVSKAERLARDPHLLDGKHGRRSTYTGWGCRCAECKAAQTAYMRTKYLEKKEKDSSGDQSVTYTSGPVS